MSLNNVKFNRNSGGLGRPLPGKDHISGLIFYHDSLPSGFGANDRIKQVLSLQQAEDLGITDDQSDETKATGGQVTIDTAGSTDDVWTVDINGTTLGTYTEQAGDATTDIATGLADAINAKTDEHGYSATANTSDVDLTAPDGLGDSINGSGLNATSDGSGTATVTQFTGGEDAFFDVIHYHVSEYFRLNPKGNLYIGIFSVPGTYDFTEIQTVQDFAEGAIRQMGVFANGISGVSSSDLDVIQGVCDTLFANYRPLSVLFAPDISGTTDLTTLPDLRSLSDFWVSVIIGQDGANQGQSLFDAKEYSISTLGATLGALSSAQVHINIAWNKQFNLAERELDSAAFSNGALFRDEEANAGLLNDRGYIFLRKFIDFDGTYHNDSHTAVQLTSDFAYIENNRTMDKAVRNVRQTVLPELNGPVEVDPDTGYLPDEFIEYIQDLGQQALEQMERDGELAGFQVKVHPEQDILSTSELVFTIEKVPQGVIRNFKINMGFTTSLS